jgi:hypothetical protein
LHDAEFAAQRSQQRPQLHACWAASVISSSCPSSSLSEPQSPFIPSPFPLAAHGLIFSSGDRQSVKPIFSNGVGPCRPYVPCPALSWPPLRRGKRPLLGSLQA